MHSGIVFDIKRYALHDGPGIRTTVFLKGCPLHCAWCHNPEGISPAAELSFRQSRCNVCGDCVEICQNDALQLIQPENRIKTINSKCSFCFECVSACVTGALEQVGKVYSVEALLEILLKDRLHYEQSGGGITFSGGEPLLQADFLGDLLRACKTDDLHCTVDTCGMVPWEHFEKIREWVDLFLYDLKLIDESSHKQYTGVSNQKILENLLKCADLGHEILVRIPFIPGITDDVNIQDIGRFMQEHSGLKKVEILPYHNIAREKYQRLGLSYSLESVKIPDPENIRQAERLLAGFGFEVISGG